MYALEMRDPVWIWIAGIVLLVFGGQKGFDWLAVVGILMIAVGWSLESRDKLTDFVDRCVDRVIHRSAFIGTSLVIFGMGIAAMLLPDVLRYVFQSDAYLMDHESIRLALAAMTVTGGWQLRHLTRWESESRWVLVTVLLVAAACILFEGWSAFTTRFPLDPPDGPLFPF